MKPKRQNKTKEQLQSELEQKAEITRKRSKVKNEFYPFLLANTESIEDARIICQAISMAIEHSFLHKKKTTMVGDLKLTDMLNEGDKSDRWRKLLEMFKDENLYDAIEIINQFPNEMDLMIRNEMKDRKLESLKMNFLD